jgi:hypothetical protein
MIIDQAVGAAAGGTLFRRSRAITLAGQLMLVVLVLGACAAEGTAQAQTGSVAGVVSSEASGRPLEGASILVVSGSWRGSATSDARGTYRLTGVPQGRGTIRVDAVGHQALELDALVAAGRDVVVDVSLRMQPVALDTINARREAADAELDAVGGQPADLAIASGQTLRASTGFAESGVVDAVRGIPGREPSDPGSILYVRGSAADLKLVYLDGAPVYAPFPLGGLLEPFAPGLLREADVYLGGAPARYDGGLSYVMDLRTRGGGQKAHVSGSVDLLSARLLAEAGVGDRLSVIASGRGVHQGIELFEKSLPYSYREGLLRTDLRIGETGLLSFTGFTNSESVRMADVAAADSVIRWANDAGSVRLRGSLGKTQAELTGSLGVYSASLPLVGTQPLLVVGEARRSRLSADFSRPMEGIQLRFGASYDRQYHVAIARTTWSNLPTGGVDGVGVTVGAYAEGSTQLGYRVLLRGGGRVDHFSSRSGLTFAPRFAATLLLTESAALTIAAGQYHQFLRPADEVLLRNPETLAMNPGSELMVGKASHFTLGLDQDVGEGVRLGVEGFYKRFSDVPETVASAGNASGVDLWVRRSGASITGWAGYSLSWVWSSAPELNQTNFVGRHLLSAGLQTPVGSRTRVDLRFAYGAGLPYASIPMGSPENGLKNTNYLQQTPVATMERGGTEAAPLLHAPDEPFLRLDASISQIWEPKVGSRAYLISPYLRLLNSFGNRDALFYYFDEKSGEGSQPLGSLPVIPVIGVEWKL